MYADNPYCYNAIPKATKDVQWGHHVLSLGVYIFVEGLVFFMPFCQDNELMGCFYFISKFNNIIYWDKYLQFVELNSQIQKEVNTMYGCHSGIYVVR